jgi:tetratricopeptide (TPR) repeat protein
MQVAAHQKSLPRLAVTLLVVLAGLITASWLLVRVRSSPVPDLGEGYFSNTIERSGAATDRAIESLQKRLRAAPNDWQSYSQLGLAYLQKARETGDPAWYQKAEGVLQKALSMEPEDYTSTSAMGALSLARHQFQTALEWGERAREINPSRTYAYGVIADSQIELGLYPDAVQTLQTMVDLRPDMSSYSRISYIRELNGDEEGAIQMMQWAVDAGGSNSENSAWTRTQLGNLYLNLGRISEAEREYEMTLAGFPDYVYALAGLGRVRAAQDRLEDAISLLERASQRIPVPEFMITLGDLYQGTGQTEAAQKQYELLKVIQKLYEANGVDMDLEIALFNADHDIDLEATLVQARQAYERRPSIYAADVLAWVLYKTGDYKEAQTLSEQALRLGTKDALKLFHAGMISARLGDQVQACDYLERAIEINPYFSSLYSEEAQRTLEQLKSAK